MKPSISPTLSSANPIDPIDACHTPMANGVGNLCVSIDLDQLWAITLPRAGHFFFCIDSRRPDFRFGSFSTEPAGPACYLMSTFASKRPDRYAHAK
jgi:hypothetical protein